jgi:hypothetical protein
MYANSKTTVATYVVIEALRCGGIYGVVRYVERTDTGETIAIGCRLGREGEGDDQFVSMDAWAEADKKSPGKPTVEGLKASVRAKLGSLARSAHEMASVAALA